MRNTREETFTCRSVSVVFFFFFTKFTFTNAGDGEFDELFIQRLFGTPIKRWKRNVRRNGEERLEPG